MRSDLQPMACSTREGHGSTNAVAQHGHGKLAPWSFELQVTQKTFASERLESFGVEVLASNCMQIAELERCQKNAKFTGGPAIESSRLY